MVKSDEHMKRVRAELIFEQNRQETTDERRKAREQKRYGKQVQAEKLKERTLQKKDSIKNLDKWRKQRKRDGFEDNGAAPEVRGREAAEQILGRGATRAVHPGVEAEEIVQGGEVRVWRTEEGTFFSSLPRSRRFFFSRSRFSGPNSPRLAHRRVRGVLPACPDT